jgi:hypothetical protein
MKLEFSPDKYSKNTYIKFNENPSSGTRVVTWGQTNGRPDVTKLIVVFRNFANAPQNWALAHLQHELGISTSSTRSTVLTKVFISCGFMALNCGRKLKTAM